MQINKYLVYGIVAYVAMGIVFLTFVFPWGYDEYGAVVTHLELDDESFVNVYKNFLYAKGIGDGRFLDFIIEIFLAIFIVPLRWTYALGISPLLGLARVIDFNWDSLRIILSIPYAVLASIGLYLVYKSLLKLRLNINVLLLFLLLLLSSPSFVHWSFSLTSYASHIFCFGLILYSEINKEGMPKVLFGRLSILRSIPMIFNYQYIPIIFFIGVFDFFQKRPFFSNKLLSWVFPGVIALLSLSFLYFRSELLGKHGNPALSVMSQNEAMDYSFIDHASSFPEVVSFLFSRIYDIFEYYFSMDVSSFISSSYSNYNFLLSLVALLLIFVIFLYFKKINSKVCYFVIAFISGHFAMNLLGILPMMPSRHALVILPPFAFMFAIIASEKLPSELFKRDFFLIAMSIWLLVNIGRYTFLENENNISMEKVDVALQNYKIDHLIMSPCSLEPVLHAEMRKKYIMLYSCGPRIIKTLPNSADKVAFYSHNGDTLPDTLRHLKDYSMGEWQLLELFDYKTTNEIIKGESRYNLFIFRKKK